MALGIARALAHLHSKRIIHGGVLAGRGGAEQLKFMHCGRNAGSRMCHNLFAILASAERFADCLTKLLLHAIFFSLEQT